MSIVVLSAMLFQTMHSYEHVFKQFAEKPCEHHTNANQKEITHSHDVDSKCHVCHFAFSIYIPNTFEAVIVQKIQIETKAVLAFTQAVSAFFKGSLFALRAPPAVLGLL
ncbi:hypothetical protein [Flavobacterium phragmitis]|uniref:DUF2946 domain-containing protein n=1 Tax=Flavobacterium phragmitis TaxID=739143 RepID=A0A1I1SF97_9FLAO|nr:hypothetical protein [Flavobacterium phragmitis]SFD45121.1 hypothetical protein SAMN05216297_10825 [Flavobacterium phragmitis]